MSLHFIIDGYNAIKRLDYLNGIDNLENARASLVRIVQAARSVRGKNNQVTVVFDGKSDFNIPENQNKGQVKILFSKGESADEIIKRIVEGSGNSRQLMVVTDDKAIIFFVRSLGARAMPVSEFFGKKQRQSDKRASRLRQRSKRHSNTELLKIELTHQQQEAINRELRRIWE